MEPIELGKYQLLKKIASGGMAEIFVARVQGLPGFEKIVVIKRILPQLATDREFIKMFVDEARIAATLHHPNIVQMYDIGVVDGSYFISMEYLHGEDIRTLMKALKASGDELAIEHAINIICGVSAGLHYAHEKKGFDGKPLGIVHRDVTPQNVFVTYDGSVKIVDFGIAKATNRFNETRYGTLKGKIPYMSPEQARSEPLDRRSDVFAIGIMLYELTTRTRLYKGASEFDILKQIVEQDVPPPSTLRQGYPPALEKIVLKALAKDRDARYQSAQALQADLEAFARENRLNVSPIALADFMRKVFGDKIEAWREAQAAGKGLAEHIVDREDSTVSEGSGLKPEDLQEVPDSKIGPTPSAAGQITRATRPGGSRPGAPIDDLADLDELPRRRRWVPYGLGGGIAAAAVLAFLFWPRSHGAHQQQSSVAGKPTPDPGTVGLPVAAVDAGAPAVLALADAAVARPAVELGALKIVTHPSGAHVYVDGKEVERSPVEVAALAIGPHTIKVEEHGYHEVSLEATVVAGETTPVNIDLKSHEDKGPRKPPEKIVTGPALTGDGELRIMSTPSCEVMVDGRSRGSTPIASIKLSPGSHTVQLVNSRFNIDRSYTVSIKPGEMTKKKYDFPVAP